MGNCAENTAKKLGLTREAQDTYALESYRKSAAAHEKGIHSAETVPVTIKGKRGRLFYGS